MELMEVEIELGLVCDDEMIRFLYFIYKRTNLLQNQARRRLEIDDIITTIYTYIHDDDDGMYL